VAGAQKCGGKKTSFSAAAYRAADGRRDLERESGGRSVPDTGSASADARPDGSNKPILTRGLFLTSLSTYYEGSSQDYSVGVGNNQQLSLPIPR